MKNNNKLLNMILAALFLAIAYVMPFLTGQIPEIGAMLCPMHLPVLLCGFICGPLWGAVVGITAPLLRSLILGMPPLFPTAICMAFELLAYGAVTGLLHKAFPSRRIYIYFSLLIAMIIGRIVWGTVMYVSMMASGKAFTFAAFLAGAITNAIPGIVVQIVLVPVLVMLLDNLNNLKMRD